MGSSYQTEMFFSTKIYVYNLCSSSTWPNGSIWYWWVIWTIRTIPLLKLHCMFCYAPRISSQQCILFSYYKINSIYFVFRLNIWILLPKIWLKIYIYISLSQLCVIFFSFKISTHHIAATFVVKELHFYLAAKPKQIDQIYMYLDWLHCYQKFGSPMLFDMLL